MEDIYEPQFVEDLFDKMSHSYARMNYLSSFGFSQRWRKQCVKNAEIEEGKTVVDLMTGMGECWKEIINAGKSEVELVGLDLSTQMLKHAKEKRQKYSSHNIKILKENVFENSIQSESADYVISAFGVKTFNQQQLEDLSKEIYRILKPKGQFSLIEVSIPKNRMLRSVYMSYLKNVIPILGKLFLGNPETYQMLGVYTEQFENSRQLFDIFKKQDFEVEYSEYFFGCATGVNGVKQ